MTIHRWIFLFCLVSISTDAGSLQSRFELQREIDGKFRAGQQGRLVLSGDVFDQTRDIPNHLRIFAPDGTQWPFFLHIPWDTSDSKSIGVDILNRSWVSGSEPYLQFDVVIPMMESVTPVHNRLEFVTTGRDFVRRVELFSGEAGDSAGHIASGYLIDFSSQRDARNRTIRYPDSDARRLHVRIYPNAQAADETFRLTSVNMRYHTARAAERESVGFSRPDVGEREKIKGAQTQILDVGYAGRPVEFMTFDVEDPSYARCVSIYGRNDEHEEWKQIGGGEIHSLPGDRSDMVRLRGRSRYLKVHVYHYDDQPLVISAIRLEAIPRYLVFEAVTEGTANLFFRAGDVSAPRYDLKERITEEAIAALPVFQTLATRPNRSAKLQAWRNYSKLAGGLAVGLVSLLVLWVIVGMLRQQTASETDQDI